MDYFKQAAELLLQKPINLESNHQFLKLIEDTYTKISQLNRRISIAEDEPRVLLANATLTQVNNVLQQ
jgi:hypothetical protein